jgi:hypothetical protein
LETIIGLTAPQPDVAPKLLTGTPQSRLVYSARSTPMIGRDHELEQLRGFLEDNLPFRWWVITGSGGAGKSRLALEFTLAHWGDWWTGFLSDTQNLEFWSNWRPEWPTLIVVDYVAAVAASIGKVVDTLQKHSREFAFPVRILLIARSADEPWWKEFLGRESRTVSESILAARFFDSPMQLHSLSTNETWAIIEHELSAARVGWSEDDKQYLSQKLTALDPSGSPMYAMLLADAFAHGEKAAKWDTALLVENVIERERVRWRAAGMARADEQALALATMIGNLKLDVISRAQGKSLLPAPEDYKPELFEPITGKPAEAEIVALSPSLIGEIFVLTLPSSRIDRRLRDIARLAFDLNARAASQFVLRVCRDFPEHPNIDDLFPENPALLVSDLSQEREENHDDWIYVACTLSGAYGMRGISDKAVSLCQGMLDSIQKGPGDPYLQVSAATAMYNLVVCSAAQGSMRFAVSTSNALGKLWRTTKIPAIGTMFAETICVTGTAAIGKDALGLGVGELAVRAAKTLEMLAADWSSPEIQVARASLLGNIGGKACESGDTDVGQTRVAELLQIQIDGPLRLQILGKQAKCLRYLCLALAKAGKFSDAEATYAELRDIVNGESSLIRWQVIALGDLIQSFVTTSALEQAWSGFQQLAALTQGREMDSEARMRLCDALGNFALELRHANAYARAESVYWALRASYFENLKICREMVVQVGAALVIAYLQIEDRAAALRLYSDVRRLLTLDPADVDVANYLGIATQVLLGSMATRELAAQGKGLLEDYWRDLYALPEDTRFNSYGVAMFYFLVGLTNPDGDRSQAQEIFRMHQDWFSSADFLASVRENISAEIADEWLRRSQDLLS